MNDFLDELLTNSLGGAVLGGGVGLGAGAIHGGLRGVGAGNKALRALIHAGALASAGAVIGGYSGAMGAGVDKARNIVGKATGVEGNDYLTNAVGGGLLRGLLGTGAGFLGGKHLGYTGKQQAALAAILGLGGLVTGALDGGIQHGITQGTNYVGNLVK